MKKHYLYIRIILILVINSFNIFISYANEPVQKLENQFTGFEKLQSKLSKTGGIYSIAIGKQTNADKDYTFTTGVFSSTYAKFSQAHGNDAIAKGEYSYSFGQSTTAQGNYSLAHGNMLIATGDYSFNFGNSNVSTGKNSLCFGELNESGDYSLSFGLKNSNSGNFSSTIGFENTNTSENSFAFGSKNNINAPSSFALGSNINISHNNSIVMGHGGAISKLSSSAPNSLSVGFNSDIPTLFISSSSGPGHSGTVGIGTTEVDPIVKLHIKGQIMIEDGTQDDGKILVSDSKGHAKWASLKELGIQVKDKQDIELKDDSSEDKNLSQEDSHKDNEDYDLINEFKRNETGISIGFDQKYPTIFINTKNIPQLRVNELGEDELITNSGNIGIGTKEPQQKLHLMGAMRLEPLDIPPENPAPGDIYFNSSGAYCGYLLDRQGYGYWETIIGSGYCS